MSCHSEEPQATRNLVFLKPKADSSLRSEWQPRFPGIPVEPVGYINLEIVLAAGLHDSTRQSKTGAL
jgi:hypothetical protein